MFSGSDRAIAVEAGETIEVEDRADATAEEDVDELALEAAEAARRAVPGWRVTAEMNDRIPATELSRAAASRACPWGEEANDDLSFDLVA